MTCSIDFHVNHIVENKFTIIKRQLQHNCITLTVHVPTGNNSVTLYFTNKGYDMFVGKLINQPLEDTK